MGADVIFDRKTDASVKCSGFETSITKNYSILLLTSNERYR